MCLYPSVVIGCYVCVCPPVRPYRVVCIGVSVAYDLPIPKAPEDMVNVIGALDNGLSGLLFEGNNNCTSCI